MKKTHCEKNGFALFSVLCIVAALSVMLGMLIQIGGQRVFTARKMVDEVKALAYAEAGIDYAYAILSADFDQKNNPNAFLLNGGGTQTASLSADNDGFFSLMMGQLEGGESEADSSATQSSYGDGTFALTITPISNKYVIVNSVGKCGSASCSAEILVDDENAGSGGSTPGTDYSSMEGFNKAVLSGGTFDFGGSGSITGSNGVAQLHSNSAINIKGSADANLDISSSVKISTGNVTVDGSLTAPKVDPHKKAVITDGYTEASVPPVEIPDIDLTPYFNWAKKHGQLYATGDTLPSDPSGGVIWVNGDVHLSSKATINGSIIATGNIHISGGKDVDISSTTTAIALASRDGDITITTSGTLKGLVYAKTGNYSQTANGTLIGQLIVNGTIKKGGNSDIIIYSRSVPTPPGGPGSSNPTTAWPVVAAWQE